MWFMDSSPYWKEMQTKNFIPKNIEHRILWSKTWIVYNKMCNPVKTWKRSGVMRIDVERSLYVGLSIEYDVWLSV